MLKRLLVLLTLCTSTAYGYADLEDLNKATAMITNRSENSGGTGVILKSAGDKSLILTNGHVCEVVKNGGLVHSSKGKVAVERYTKSDQHDLCMIEVVDNLGVNTDIASSGPKVMDKTYVAGHPYLFPTTVTEGHLSSSMIIQIVLGTRACTPEEIKKNAFLCFWFDGMPLIRELNTNAVSNIIAPGNSGSAVYNASGELIGLIFAGAGRGMSPGIIVPYEYLKSFVETEYAGGKLKAVEVATAKALFGSGEEEAGNRKSTNIELKDLKGNLVFAAIKDPTLDKIETKLRTCVKAEAGGCSNLTP